MSITGVLLAGGTGSRLRPLTNVTNKHLLAVYDRPMIFYPLNNLILAGIRKIFVVTGGEHFDSVGRLLGSGKRLEEGLGISNGMIDSLAYGVQDRAGGIAEALGLAKEFVGKDNVAVVLGDNIFEREDFLREAVERFEGGGDLFSGAHLFLKKVQSDRLYEKTEKGLRAKYGMAELKSGRVIGIEEKPETPKSNYAVTGAYIYDNKVFDVISGLKPSGRGELEITDVNNHYISQGMARYSFVKGDWTDAGSIETLHRAGNLIEGKRKRELKKTHKAL